MNEMISHKLQILECTLRDGSYAINFQFSKSDTINLGKALEDLGFTMIELGHGVGLGASERGHGIAAESDEGYLNAAANTFQKALWGMFCIPGIAHLDDIYKASCYKMKFIRIGTNVEDYKNAQPYIEKAKKHNMLVCANFMKSYICPPDIMAKYAAEAEKFGADVIYIVDSAGGMLPHEIECYVNAIREKVDKIKIGFHGHNNMGLAVANALKAAEIGVNIIDSSLQGFGRSAGNTSTEQFLCTLLRRGINIGIDPILVMDVGEKYILPLIRSKGLSSMDITAGFALFHSSYMKIIEQYALEYRVDPRRLIIAVCQFDKVNASKQLVEREAKRLSETGVEGHWNPLYNYYFGNEQNP